MHFTQSPAHDALCRQMIDTQLKSRGIHDQRVLAAMAAIPRHAFVAETYQAKSYDDCALPSAVGQTISQPYIVALMSQMLHIQGGELVLEVGTGTGYQTAILAHMVGTAGRVYTIERMTELHEFASKMLRWLQISNVEFHRGDGSTGWPTPDMQFDRILVTAGAPEVPQPLRHQLADNGILVAPVGDESHQYLVRITRRGNQFLEDKTIECRFVPLIGEYGWQR